VHSPTLPLTLSLSLTLSLPLSRRTYHSVERERLLFLHIRQHHQQQHQALLEAFSNCHVAQCVQTRSEEWSESECVYMCVVCVRERRDRDEWVSARVSEWVSAWINESEMNERRANEWVSAWAYEWTNESEWTYVYMYECMNVCKSSTVCANSLWVEWVRREWVRRERE